MFSRRDEEAVHPLSTEHHAGHGAQVVRLVSPGIEAETGVADANVVNVLVSNSIVSNLRMALQVRLDCFVDRELLRVLQDNFLQIFAAVLSGNLVDIPVNFVSIDEAFSHSNHNASVLLLHDRHGCSERFL